MHDIEMNCAAQLAKQCAGAPTELNTVQRATTVNRRSKARLNVVEVQIGWKLRLNGLHGNSHMNVVAAIGQPAQKFECQQAIAMRAMIGKKVRWMQNKNIERWPGPARGNCGRGGFGWDSC